MMSLQACGTLSNLLGIEEKPPAFRCDPVLLEECKFTNFSGLLNIPKIPGDLAGSVATVASLEGRRCALEKKQLIKCIKESK